MTETKSKQFSLLLECMVQRDKTKLKGARNTTNLRHGLLTAQAQMWVIHEQPLPRTYMLANVKARFSLAQVEAFLDGCQR